MSQNRAGDRGEKIGSRLCLSIFVGNYLQRTQAHRRDLKGLFTKIKFEFSHAHAQGCKGVPKIWGSIFAVTPTRTGRKLNSKITARINPRDWSAGD
ncbi:MAG: hypothetical protein U1D70_19705 [Methylobacter sp.]|nr:hypothetical protein [Methylobacter sp.]MDZ4221235.1 hypothetical protein [Methylobacter sp.]